MNIHEEKEMDRDDYKNAIQLVRRLHDLAILDIATKNHSTKNHATKDRATKGIVLLGNSGVGKSTLACAITGEKLQSVMDEDTCELRIDSVEPHGDFIIGHGLSQETELPGKGFAGDVVIWDCLGFDNNDHVKRMANKYFIKFIFNQTHQLKFVLVVPEPDLRFKRGSDFLETLSNFMNIFQNIQDLYDSISLVVTKVNQRKTIQHIREAIESILISNPRVTVMHRELMKKIHSSVYLFHEPSGREDAIELPGLLESIDSTGKYSVINEKMVAHIGNAIVCDELYTKFLKIAKTNFYFIVETIFAAIFDATNGITINAHNPFCKNHYRIKDWIPDTLNFYIPQEEKKGYFLHLELLSKLLDTIPDAVISEDFDEFQIFSNILDVFQEFAQLNSGLRRQIQDYCYCLLIFSTFGNGQQWDFSNVSSRLKECRERIKEKLKSEVVSLCLDKNNTDEGYYHRAISFLKNYQESEECMKRLAVAHQCLDVITQQKNEHKGQLGEAKVNAECNKNIIKLSNCIRDGNQRIQHHAVKGILLLGNTGVGKSTIACAITGRKLQSVMDEDTCEMRIDSVEPLSDIIIGHHSSSETKIPNKCFARDIIIWDCPGYDDTDPVQEIANRFYIKRLFEITHQLKFVLVVPESDLQSKRGCEFLETLSNFINMFENVRDVLDSISLVVTKVNPRKTIKHICNAIESIKTTNQSVTEIHKELIDKLLSSLYLFHEPSETADVIELPGLFESIESSGKYSAVNGEMVTVSISRAGKELSSSLLKAAVNNFYLIVETIAAAIFDATNCITVSNSNPFCKNHSRIKEWVPESVNFNTQQEKKKEYFLLLELLSLLLDVIPDADISDVSDALKIFQNVLQVFREFAEFNSGLHHLIQEYGYCLQQQHEYVKFFTTVCEAEQCDYSDVYSRLKECHEHIEAELESAVISLDVAENNKDEGYYHRAIMFLKKYQDSEECMKRLAVAYKCLGFISQEKDVPTALIYFIKSVKAYREQPEIYDKLGELFTAVAQYSQAIECYKVINNAFKIKQCYKMWLKKQKNSPEIIMDQAAYFQSIGLLGKAAKYYAYASGLSTDTDVKSAALEKWGKILTDSANPGKDLIERASKKDFYKFSTVDEAFVENLLNKVDLKRSESGTVSTEPLKERKNTKNVMKEISKLWRTMSSAEKHRYANKWKYMDLQKFLKEIGNERESNSDDAKSDDDNDCEKTDGDEVDDDSDDNQNDDNNDDKNDNGHDNKNDENHDTNDNDDHEDEDTDDDLLGRGSSSFVSVSCSECESDSDGETQFFSNCGSEYGEDTNFCF